MAEKKCAEPENHKRNCTNNHCHDTCQVDQLFFVVLALLFFQIIDSTCKACQKEFCGDFLKHTKGQKMACEKEKYPKVCGTDKDKERRKKLREERRRRAEERRRRDQAARDTVFRQQTRDALDKTNYEINRQQIEFQIQEQERIRRERINNELAVNIPGHAEVRSNETKEFIQGTQVFW